jgi:diguanylate cyclase (GGDEF)-like protein
LREVAKTLSGALRSTDIVGRWGGDEFIAVLQHVDGETLRDLAERCCVLVVQTSFASTDGSPVSMSVSVGGTFPYPDDTAEGLVKRADELMYQSKTSGRGRVSTK